VSLSKTLHSMQKNQQACNQ